MSLTTHRLESSNLQAAGHQDDTLYLRFHSGGTYQYANVPDHVFSSLLEAPSAGHYFFTHIKGRYPYTKLNHDPLANA